MEIWAAEMLLGASAVDSFSQSINNFLSTYYVPVTVLSPRDEAVKNTDM